MTLLKQGDGIILAGPTASGKSILGLELAHYLKAFQDVEIINADSMQIYQNLSLLTARPNEEACAAIPHSLYGAVEANHRGSVAWWLKEAEHQVALCKKRGAIPLFIGGTGMYLRALTEGLSKIPLIEEETRQQVRYQAAELGPGFYDYVCSKDPLIEGNLKSNDTQRLERALEVVLQTKKSIVWWQNQPKTPSFSYLYCVLLPPKEFMYRNINQRFEKMIKQGGIEEVKTLNTLTLPIDSPILKAIGVREITRFLEGQDSLEIAIENSQKHSRRYAKRQMTWFRHQVNNKIVLEKAELAKILPHIV